jgi:hypothetical protein
MLLPPLLLITMEENAHLAVLVVDVDVVDVVVHGLALAFLDVGPIMKKNK